MKLTIGMATHDDFHGVYFTIQALRLANPICLTSEVEFVVVDSNPGGLHSEKVVGFLQSVPNARYFAMIEANGTAAPRDRVFREARGEYVICLDCHVLLPTNAISRLLAYYADHPETRDLITGPLQYDPLTDASISTHFGDVWRDQMRGIWATAWKSPEGDLVTFAPSQNGLAVLNLEQTSQIGSIPIPFAGHESYVSRMGYRHPDEPFEIPGQGLGFFTCRRDAWLGFNPDFRGFGGEELYIHEKYRRAGAKCICLPWLRWVHRFARPDGVPYRLDTLDKVRNYVIGHKELGLDLTPVWTHFVQGVGMDERLTRCTQSQWEAIIEGKPTKTTQEGAAPCGACVGKSKESLETWYETASRTPSDINEHVETLRRYASQCKHVTEFGVRSAVSTVGLLAAQPSRLISYDIQMSAEAEHLKRLQGETNFEFVVGDSTKVQIEPTEMLFVDTKHTADQLWAEFENLAKHVSRYIVLHDTVIFGETGEDGGPGLMPAVRRFVTESPEWTVIRHDRNNHGLLVLSRDSRDKKKLPSLLQQGINFTRTMAKHIMTGSHEVDPDTYRVRLEICGTCESRTDEKCGECGCPLEKKNKLGVSFCDLGKWHAVNSEAKV